MLFYQLIVTQWRHVERYLLLLISMLWHRQAIFESKGDKLSSSAECRIRTHQGLRHQIASRLNARWQTDWAIEDQAKNLNSTARRYDQRTFSPLEPIAVWHSQLALAITCYFINSLWLNDAMWRDKHVSTLPQVKACCLMEPSHYPNQCWLFIKGLRVSWEQFPKKCSWT